MAKNDDKKYYASAVISIVLTIILHYLLFSRVDMHPTLHVFIGILIFFVIMGITALSLKKK